MRIINGGSYFPVANLLTALRAFYYLLQPFVRSYQWYILHYKFTRKESCYGQSGR